MFCKIDKGKPDPKSGSKIRTRIRRNLRRLDTDQFRYQTSKGTGLGPV